MTFLVCTYPQSYHYHPINNDRSVRKVYIMYVIQTLISTNTTEAAGSTRETTRTILTKPTQMSHLETCC